MKNKYFLAILAGCLCALAFAPFHFFIAAMISISAFYFLLEKKCANPKQAAQLGLAYGYGYFLAGIYWVSISLLVDAERFGWLVPFALTLLPGVLAIYFSAMAFAYKKILSKFHFQQNYQKILIFAILWLCAEALRSVLLSGFPWNLLGYSFLFNNYFSQSASYFSVYGLSLFACIICLTPTLFKKPKISDKIFLSIIAFLVIANAVFGYWRIHHTDLIEHEDFKMRLVQGNIKQNLKWDPAEKYRNFLRHIHLSNEADQTDVRAVIWSETSVPYAIDDNADLMELLTRSINNKAILITGGLRIEYTDITKTTIKNVWNSVFAINKGGIIDYYDKHHLVPFGEYVPFANLLPFVDKITDGASGFSTGEGPQTLETGHFNFSPLICYEVIFPSKIIDKKNRPDLLINVTNDAWFGSSTGPYQHLDSAKMRAIEYGISLARVANTGISAYIDPLGNVRKSIPLNEQGFFDVNFIDKIPTTTFSKLSYLPLGLVITALAMLLIFTTKKKK